MLGIALQISSETVLAASFFVALIVALIISLILYFIARRGQKSLALQFHQITNDLNNLKLGLPRYDDVTSVRQEVGRLSEEQKNFTESLSTQIDAFKRTQSQEIENIRKDIVDLAERKALEAARQLIENNSVSRDEFQQLREHTERLLGAQELAERLMLLGSVFDTNSIKTLVWQCKLIRLTEQGLAPEAEEDLILQAGIPLSTGKTFLKKLNEIGIVDMKKVESYFLVPEYTWLLSYIENPDWLKQRLESFVKREEEYQKYIRDNISLVEEGLILVSEQYPLDSGRIDIVCRDVNGKDVGLELKYPSANNEVLGQIMRYREDYRRLTANGNARFVLVAPTIPDKLQSLLTQNNIEFKQIQF